MEAVGSGEAASPASAGAFRRLLRSSSRVFSRSPSLLLSFFSSHAGRPAGLNFGTYLAAGRRAARIGDTACGGATLFSPSPPPLCAALTSPLLVRCSSPCVISPSSSPSPFPSHSPLVLSSNKKTRRAAVRRMHGTPLLAFALDPCVSPRVFSPTPCCSCSCSFPLLLLVLACGREDATPGALPLLSLSLPLPLLSLSLFLLS